jgi:signal transduction histidine kinase
MSIIQEVQQTPQIILIVAFTINLFFFIQLLKRKEKEALIFAIAVVGLLIWTICVFFYPLFKNPRILYIIGILAYWGPVITATSILLFSYLFPKPIKLLNAYHKIIIISGGVIAIIITLIPNFVLKSATTEGYKLITGRGVYPLFFIIGFFLAWALVNLIKKYFILSGIYKLQLKYLFIGIFLTFIIGFTSNAILATLDIYYYVWIGPAVTVIFVTFATYSIIKHHLLNIRVIATELLVTIVGIILLIQTLTTQTLGLRVFSFGLLAAFAVMGYLLIRYTYLEIKRREEMEALSEKLKIANVKLDGAYQELEILNKAKSEFISIASHQLRTPLTAIKGYISMILEEAYGKLPEKSRRPMENVYNSAERLIKLINDILNVTKIETGRMEMSVERASPEDIILSVLEELKIKAKEKNLYLNFEEPAEPFPKLLIDRDKIRQVVLNIIDNAIRYTQKGGVTIKLKTENEKLKIIVSDTGEGMTKDDLAKLFESFSRATAGSRFYSEGAGLGLYIARRFVEMHKGRIWATSEGKDKGSTFYIELPIR